MLTNGLRRCCAFFNCSRDDCEIFKQFKARPLPGSSRSSVGRSEQSVNPADKPVGLAEAEPSTIRTEERGKAKPVVFEHRRLAQRRQVRLIPGTEGTVSQCNGYSNVFIKTSIPCIIMKY